MHCNRMKLFLFFISAIFIKVSGFNVEENEFQLNRNAEEQKTFQENIPEKSDDALEALTECLFKQIIEGMHDVLSGYAKNNNETINEVLGVNNFPTNIITKQSPSRNKRDISEVEQQQLEPSALNKCVSRSELAQHTATENNHILLIKQELVKLRELLRLLQDQQYVLSILNDLNDKTLPKVEQDKELMEFMNFLKTHQANKISNSGKPESKLSEETIELSLNKLTEDITQLKNMIDAKQLKHAKVSNMEEQLKQDLEKQKEAIEDLRNIILNMQGLKTVPIHLHKPEETDFQTNSTLVSESKARIQQIKNEINELKDTLSQLTTQNVNNPDFSIVGAPVPHFPKSHRTMLEVLQDNARKVPTDNTEVPKPRAEDDQFLDNLQKLFGDLSDSSADSKELNSGNIESKLQDLEREIKLATRIHQLEKQLKSLQDSSESETKSFNDNEDIKAQLKKLQKQIKKLNQGKPQNKELDEEDELQDRLKALQATIDNLKPKSKGSNGAITEGKDGSINFQSMLSKLLNIQPAPIPVIQPPPPPPATITQLTPAQIQLLKAQLLSVNKPSALGQSDTQGLYTLFGIPSKPSQHSLSGQPLATHYGYPVANLYGSVGQDTHKISVGFCNPLHDEKGISGFNQFGFQSTFNPQAPNFALPTDGIPQISNKQHVYQEPINIGGSGIFNNGKNDLYTLNLHSAKDLHKTGLNVPQQNQNRFFVVPTGFSSATYEPNLSHATQSNSLSGMFVPNIANYVSLLDQNRQGYDNVNSNERIQDIKTFFPGYEKQGYQEIKEEIYKPTEYAELQNPEKFYSNSQQGPYSSNKYVPENVKDLEAQIHNLENIINNLNNPEYFDKPEDQEVLYNVDAKNGDLKGVTDLSENSNLVYGLNYPQLEYDNARNVHQTKSNSYLRTQTNSNKPSLQRKRHAREITKEDYNNLNNTTPGKENMFEHLVPLIEIMGNLSQNPSTQFTEEHELTSTFIKNILSNHSQPQRNVREVREPTTAQNNKTIDGFSLFLQQLSDLYEVYKYISESLKPHNKTHNETPPQVTNRNARQISIDQEKINIRQKRQLDGGENTDTREAVAAMASFFTDLFKEVREQEKSLQSPQRDSDDAEQQESDEESEESITVNKHDFQTNQDRLKQKLADLKQQYQTAFEQTATTT